MVDGEKTNKVRIVDDEREAAHIARTGETPIPFTGHMECPGCLDGRVTHNHDLRPPPKDPSHRRFRHLTHQHEHNHWSVRRLPKGRMTADDILGHQVPHPFEMIHHT